MTSTPTRLARILLMTLALSWPLPVAAEPPAGVTGVTAVLEGNQIRVGWNAVTGVDAIAYYRIYYSRKSILQNGGAYDDFDVTTGNRTDFILTEYPRESELYVSVLAVNAAGEETKYFQEEAVVSVQGGQASSQGQMSSAATSSLSSSSAQASEGNVVAAENPPAPTQFALAAVTPVSSTGVLLVFSHTLQLSPADAPLAFSITDGSGTVLTLRRLTIAQERVFIDTFPQEPGKQYIVRVAPVVSGKDALGAFLPLDPEHSSLRFTGFGTPAAVIPPPAPLPTLPVPDPTPLPPPPPPSPSTIVPEVLNLSLNAQAPTPNAYVALAQWQAPEGPINGYEVSVSRDDGKTFGNPQTIPPTANTVRFRDVTPGAFGVLIRVIDIDNTASTGTFTSTILPGTNTIPPTTKSNLPKSGVGVLFSLMLTGTAVGWKEIRRRKSE